mmetsp:Transcript_16125/g.34856  ORF Transcript_16125/g.34856 Transcript_16125/m.34856 type:complete len:381 (-) Transcript_16125:101-1243(-)|eukprot:CAMPEP_0206600678 /NCGR_PEP_ID=MMETSP0325_2-20121206/45997_1 /ASSEMBLY_ACC=CAM_ASM_000347 /TAXON_ID=2866 /ORGANISM="Crypthecodinium cohnii, Strain Seligo" /LENGTH=380 /DNA_ID=CAMNT_0054112145 /DNA_START=114 /DNA_END=1256 /DNA_ORIENTATION=+
MSSAASSSQVLPPKVDIVIVGGGIVGCASAYFLAKRGYKPLLVERCEVACAASGKAGGFLAREWGSGVTEALHHQGFDLHEQLAAELGVESFRKLPTLRVSDGRGPKMKDYPWVDLGSSAEMDDDTAQVNPKELTTKLMDAAVGMGATLHIGIVSGLKRSDEQVTAVIVDDKEVACDHAVFTMGPWSGALENWLPDVRIPMESVLSTSLRFALPAPVDPPCVLFCAEDKWGCHLEVNPRNDSTLYVCGCGGSKYLDNSQVAALPPEKVVADPKRVKAAWESLRAKTSVTGDIEPESAACMRPCPDDSLPLIGTMMDNIVLACGHNCWGILWGPITGKIVAELIAGEEPSLPLKAFRPDRFAPKATKRGRHNKAQPVGEQW